MNVIARLEYELAYYDSVVHRFNHYTTRTLYGISLRVDVIKNHLLSGCSPALWPLSHSDSSPNNGGYFTILKCLKLKSFCFFSWLCRLDTIFIKKITWIIDEFNALRKITFPWLKFHLEYLIDHNSTLYYTRVFKNEQQTKSKILNSRYVMRLLRFSLEFKDLWCTLYIYTYIYTYIPNPSAWSFFKLCLTKVSIS